MNLRKMLGVLRAYRANAPLGDVVMLKLDALSNPPAEVVRKLERVQGFAPEHDLSALRRLPAGSLGQAYVRHLDHNGILPLVVSARVQEYFRDRPYALRYTVTHDLHHVLTGFDTGLAGEIGVLAFNVAQGSAPVGRAMLWLACALYALLSPTQAARIWHNARVGHRLGRAAELVIAEPVESYFAEPLEQVRSKLGIADPRPAGVLPSGTSLIEKLLHRPKVGPGRPGGPSTASRPGA